MPPSNAEASFWVQVISCILTCLLCTNIPKKSPGNDPILCLKLLPFLFLRMMPGRFSFALTVICLPIAVLCLRRRVLIGFGDASIHIASIREQLHIGGTLSRLCNRYQLRFAFFRDPNSKFRNTPNTISYL